MHKDPIGTEIPSLNIQPLTGSKKVVYLPFFDKKPKFIYSDCIPKNIGKILK